MKTGRCSGLERALLPPLGALVRAIMRTQAAVLRAAGSTCQRSQKDYPQFAEFTQIRRLHMTHETANLAHYLNLVTNFDSDGLVKRWLPTS